MSFNKIFKLKVHHTSTEKAQEILNPRHGDQCFNVYEGSTFCSLEDFAHALETMSAASYIYHANREKNDFINWTRDVLHDDELSDQLHKKAKNQDDAIKIVQERLEELRDMVSK